MDQYQGIFALSFIFLSQAAVLVVIRSTCLPMVADRFKSRPFYNMYLAVTCIAAGITAGWMSVGYVLWMRGVWWATQPTIPIPPDVPMPWYLRIAPLILTLAPLAASWGAQA